MPDPLLVDISPFRHPVALPFPTPKLRGRSFQDSYFQDAPATLPKDWTQLGDGTWQTTASGVQHTGGTNDGMLVADATSFEPGDSDQEADFSPACTNFWGLCCRAQDLNNLYVVRYESSPGQFKFYRRVSGGYTALGSVAWPVTLPLRLRLVSVGSLLTLYVNDRFALSVTDSTFATGSVGYFASNGQTLVSRYLRAVAL